MDNKVNNLANLARTIMIVICSAFGICESSAVEQATSNSVEPISSSKTNLKSSPNELPQTTIVMTSFESVEKEKLKIAKGLLKLEKDEADFREEVIVLQKKLAEASIAAITPTSLPTDYASFINASSKSVERTAAYYDKLKATLNVLTSESPYLAHTSLDGVDPQRAGEMLKQLGMFDEDEGQSKVIINQWSAKEGGVRDDAIRRAQINNQLNSLQKELERLQWNLNMGRKINPLNGEQSRPDSVLADITDQIQSTKVKVDELKEEDKSFNNFATTPLRKLEFQQFIIQLAAQQRYLHALIACGFYRNVFSGGDMSIQNKGNTANNGNRSQNTAPSSQNQSSPGTAGLQVFSTIPSLESFLLNRIRDAKLDRDSIENMIKSKQMAAAESVLRKMVATSKYQPELQTFPTEDRLKIQSYSQLIRSMSEAITSKNYPEILNLSDKLEQTTSDVSGVSFRAFAKSNSDKALLWAKQGKLAFQMGDVETGQTLLNAACQRAPMDKKVAEAVEQAQDISTINAERKEQYDRIVKANDYAQAFQRMGEFIPLIAATGDENAKKELEHLIDEEKSVKETLEKCEELEKMNAHVDAWILLDTLTSPFNSDKRVTEKKSTISPQCGSFLLPYTNAQKYEKLANKPVALSWYLQALACVPSNTQIKDNIKRIGNELIN